MQRERLTPDRIRRFTCSTDKKQEFLWDTESPRLAVRATAGAKSFVFESKLNRQTIRITIGDVRAWPLESVWEGKGMERREVQRGAREEANRLEGLINQGIDPRHEKAERLATTKAKQEIAKHREAPALEAWKVYTEARKKKWSANTFADHEYVSKEGGEPHKKGRKPGQAETTQPGALRSLLERPLTEITPDAVQAWLKEEVERRPTHAALAYRMLRAFIRWCAGHDDYAILANVDAVSPKVSKDNLPKAKTKEGDCLQREQLEPWFAAVRALHSPVQRTYLQGLLLTGARREEMADLRWEDVDFQWRSLRIRDKVDGERIIPLTPYLAGLLLELKRCNDTPPPEYRILHGKRIKIDLENWKPSPWVFNSPTAASGRIEDPRAAHVRALDAAGLPHLSLHGLRRSFGTLAEWVEVPTGVVAQIQGHKPSAIAEKHYRRRPLDLLRLWHTRIETWILEQAGIEQPKEEAKPGLKVATA